MMGHYQLGTAEPGLWNTDHNPAILSSTRDFVRKVWPVFRAAGKRPKGAPIMLPIFSNTAYWMERTPEERLSAFSNLKQWIVDDLRLPPDYWILTSYQDQETFDQRTGIRKLDGTWRTDLLPLIRQQAESVPRE